MRSILVNQSLKVQNFVGSYWKFSLKNSVAWTCSNWCNFCWTPNYNTQILESKNLWICGCRDMKILGPKDPWMQRYKDLSVHDCRDMKIYKIQDVWTHHGCRGTGIGGSVDVDIWRPWSHGCSDTGIWGSTDARDLWNYGCKNMNIRGYIDLGRWRYEDLWKDSRAELRSKQQ